MNNDQKPSTADKVSFALTFIFPAIFLLYCAFLAGQI